LYFVFLKIEDFWRAYSYIIRVKDFPPRTSLHFFVEGIKPTWEDEKNAGGGKFAFSLKDFDHGAYLFEMLVCSYIVLENFI
jgi:hypothetical protein